MSLSKEFQKPLDHLEDLLEHWIAEQGEGFQPMGPSTMIGLCCARGIVSSFLKTVQILQNMLPSTKLPVRKVLRKLCDMKVRVGLPCAILGSNHVKTIPYDDKLIPEIDTGTGTLPRDVNTEPETDQELLGSANWHVMATDGSFVYVSGGKGKGLSKVGTGHHGTIQGYVYNLNHSISTDFLAFGNNMLVVG